MKCFWLLLKRDLLIAYRHPAEWVNPIFFFVLIMVLFPLAISPDPKKLILMGPGVIWISILFANMLSIEHILSDDFEDGYLEQIILSTESLPLLVTAKLIAHWLITVVPLLMVTLIFSQFFFLPFQTVIIIFVSLLLGTPVLIIIGALAAALTLGLQHRGIMLILMVLPLYLPILIFGAGAGNDAVLNLPVSSQLAFLGAFLTLALTFGPMSIAAALKISLD